MTTPDVRLLIARRANNSALAAEPYQEADLYEDEQNTPRLYLQYFDINELTSRKGNYTLNLKLPKTARNSQLLGFVGDLQAIDTFVSQPTYAARLIAGDRVLLDGVVTIDQITPDSYEGDLTGNNIYWADLMRQRSMREVQLPTFRYSGVRGTNHDAWPENVADTVTMYEVWQTSEAEGYSCQFPLIGYGNFPCDPANADINPINGVLTIAESAGVVDGAVLENTSDWPLRLFDFYPAPYLRDVVRQMLKDVGYLAAGKFFDSDDFANLILPCVRPNDASVEWNWNILGRVGMNRDGYVLGNLAPYGAVQGEINNGLSDDGNYSWNYHRWGTILNTELERYAYDTCFLLDSTTSQTDLIWRAYVAPADGTFRVTLDVSQILMEFDGVPFAAMIVVRNGQPDFLGDDQNGLIYTQGADDTTFYFDPQVKAYHLRFDPDFPNTPFDFTITSDVELRAGGIVEIVFVQAASTIPVGLQRYSIEAGGYAKLTIEPLTFDTELQPAKFFPKELNQAEFLKSVLQTFNLYAFVNGNTITIDPRNNYFLPPITAVDWSDKASLDEATSSLPTFYKNIKFRWNDEANEPLFDKGAYDYDRTTAGITYTDTLEITPIFAPTGMRNQLVYRNNTNSLSIEVPSMGTEDDYQVLLGEVYLNGKPGEFNLRMLRWLGLETDTPALSDNLYIEDSFISNNGFNVGGRFVWPRAAYVPDNGTTRLSWNDDFGQGLVTKYYEGQLEQIQRTVVVTLPVMLMAEDVESIDVRRPVRIGSNLFIINKVDGFDPQGNKRTRVIFYRI